MDSLDLEEPRTLLFTTAGLLLALAAAAAFAEHRRNRRGDVDKVGWVPWNMIQALAFLLAMAAAGLALKL